MADFRKYMDYGPEVLSAFDAMEQCPQSPVHHAEGNVAVHTRMVFDEVEKLYGTISSYESSLLSLAAVFHDVAKPKTTVWEDGDWRSPRHAKLGEPVFRELMWKSVPLKLREEVAAIIRYHGLPIWSEHKTDPDMAVIEASLRCRAVDLARFAECDFRGRICQDLEDSLFRIELFRERAENLGCSDKPYEFTSDWASLHYFKNGGYPGKEIYRPNGSDVTIMVGVAGSGKSTWVDSNWGDKVVELDAIRKELKIKPTDRNGQGTVAQLAKERFKESLRKKEPVLWNATNITKQQRSSIVDIATTYDARVRMVYIEKDLGSALSQNRSRENVVPEAAVKKMMARLEIPTLTECHELEVVT